MARQSSAVKEKEAPTRQSAKTRTSQQHNNPQKTDARATRQMTPAELDRVIHERMRLAIVSALAVNSSLTFNDLKQMLNTTDGNLSVHARKLEEANYVVCNKYFDGRTPKTEYKLTTSGRRALERYLNHMEAIIRKTREG